MNTFRKIALSLVLTGFAAGASAQVLTQNEKRRLRIEAFQLLNKYEQTSTLYDDNEQVDFRYLFPDEGISIYNDILGASAADSMNVDDYVELGTENMKHATATLKNVKVERIWATPDANMVEFSFKKRIIFSNACGAIIDASRYFGSDYSMKAVIAVNRESGDARIVSLTGNVSSSRPRLEPGYSYVDSVSPYVSNVKVDGQRLAFSHGQALVPHDPNFSYVDDDVRMTPIKVAEGHCSHYDLCFRPMRWRLKAYADISLGSPFSVRAPGVVSSRTSATDFGLDFGYVFPSNSKFRIGAFVGVGYSMAKVVLSIGSLAYNYDASASADMDGDIYRRYYTLSNVSQSISLGRLAIPIYADFEYRFHRMVAVYANFGFKLQFNAAVMGGDISGESDSWGVYPQYDDLVMRDDWLNDFGSHKIDSSFPKAEELSAFGASLLVGVGVRVKIFGPLSFDAGVRYQMGLTNISKAGNSAPALGDGSTTEADAPVTYSVAGGTQVRSLSGYLSSLKVQGLKLNVGLVMKF